MVYCVCFRQYRPNEHQAPRNSFAFREISLPLITSVSELLLERKLAGHFLDYASSWQGRN